MVKRIASFLNRKYSVLLVLVPFINLVYVIGFFLFCTPLHLFEYGFPVLIGTSLLLFLLNRFFLPSLIWTIPLIMMVLLSILAYIYLRRNITGKERVKKIRACLVCVFSFFVLVVGGFAILKDPIEPKVDTLLNALVEQNEEKLNTVMLTNNEKLSKFSKPFERMGIILQGDVKILRRNSFHVSFQNRKEIFDNSYEVQIGEYLFTVNVIYEKTTYGEGFTSCDFVWHSSS